MTKLDRLPGGRSDVAKCVPDRKWTDRCVRKVQTNIRFFDHLAKRTSSIVRRSMAVAMSDSQRGICRKIDQFSWSEEKANDISVRTLAYGCLGLRNGIF